MADSVKNRVIDWTSKIGSFIERKIFRKTQDDNIERITWTERNHGKVATALEIVDEFSNIVRRLSPL